MWLPIEFRVHFKILVMMFRALYCQDAYIKNRLLPCESCRDLRPSDQGLVAGPRSRLKTKGWNSSPIGLVGILRTLLTFKKQLETHFFARSLLLSQLVAAVKTHK